MCIRDRVGIFSGTEYSRDEMVIKVREIPPMTGLFLADDVTTDSTYVIAPPPGV